MGQCVCDVFGNLGTTGCLPAESHGEKLWFVPLIAADNTENRIDLANLPDNAAIDALINQTDKTKRYYVSPTLTDFASPAPDPITKEYDGGEVDFVRNGIRNVTSVIRRNNGGNSTMVGQLEKWRCRNYGVFIIDDCNNIIGRKKGDGYLYPIPVDAGSMAVNYQWPLANENQEIAYSFNLKSLWKDSDLGWVNYDLATTDLLAKAGLLDVVFTATNPTTSGADINAVYLFGDASAPEPVTGLLLADVSLFNNTTQLPVVITSFDAVVGSDGNYTLVFPSQTASDELVLTVSKTGLEQSTVTFTV